jgi:hypothetical protein
LLPKLNDAIAAIQVGDFSTQRSRSLHQRGQRANRQENQRLRRRDADRGRKRYHRCALILAEAEQGETEFLFLAPEQFSNENGLKAVKLPGIQLRRLGRTESHLCIRADLQSQGEAHIARIAAASYVAR